MQSAAPELIDLSRRTQADARHVRRRPAPSRRATAAAAAGTGQFTSFATNCLLARRLVERGVRFVNISTPRGTITATSTRSWRYNCRMADQPVAALLKDLKQRGLLD